MQKRRWAVLSMMLIWPLLAGLTNEAMAQRSALYGDEVRRYIAMDDSVIALTHVRLIDGTGAGEKEDQTVLIRQGRIGSVGPSALVDIPEGARIVDLEGHTAIPGIIGMHGHMYYGNGRFMEYSGPRLYLGRGVTTIRTVGSSAPLVEVQLGKRIERGESPGPTIYPSGPYISGVGGSSVMITPKDEDHIRQIVTTWADRGVEWMKVYRHISRADLKAFIMEAHKQGVRVTGHLCSVTLAEAAEVGIDNLEHGFITSTDYVPNKKPDECPRNARSVLRTVDVQSDSVQATIRYLVQQGVAITSTLSIFETAFAHRSPADTLALAMLSPEMRKINDAYRKEIDDAGDTWRYQGPLLKKAMDFEYAFVRAGGLLVAGVDPGRHNMPGFGNLRNYQLLLEAGFTAPEVIQIMTFNGARLLGVEDELGSIEEEKWADIVILEGDIVKDPARIKAVRWVFKDGIGYDASRLINDARGLVGTR